MELRAKEKFSYGIGAVGKDMVYMLSASFILYYYQDVLGINAIFMGVVLMVARVFDAINDPFMGIIVAKTKSKWGQFRPWLFSGTVLNAVILFAMFAAPQSLSGNGLKVYSAVLYILWGVTYTMMDIPYWSMIPAFTSGSKERESLSQLARSCAGVGSALITVITMKAVFALGGGNERAGFKWFALIIALLFVVTETICCLNIKEKSTVDMKTSSIGEMFKALFANDQAMVVVAAIVLVNSAMYITSNLMIYFFKYDFGGEGWYNTYTLFTTFGGAVQILSMMLLYPLIRKFLSALQVFRLSLLMALVGYIALLIIACTNMHQFVLLCIPGFLIFAALGMLTVLTTLFLANSVDYGEVKNGRRDESVIFSMQTFVVKLASGVAVLIASVCLQIFNISKDNSEGVVQTVLPTGSAMGLRMTMSVIPIVLIIAAAILFAKRFILTEEKVEELAKQLKQEKE